MKNSAILIKKYLSSIALVLVGAMVHLRETSILKQNRSRRFQYIQSFDIIFNFDIFWHFDQKWRIQSTKYYHNRNYQVNFNRNRHLTCLVSKAFFLSDILIFFSKTWSAILAEINNWFHWFWKANSRRQLLPPLQFWRKSEQNCDRESAPEKSA